MGNHDEPRIATRLGPAQARAAMMLLLTLRGTPTLYYGDEIGMEDVPIPPECEQDLWNKLTPGLGLGRDPERTPMQWDGADNAGFCAPGVLPWLPIAADFRRRNVEAQRGEPRSMLSLTRALLALRRATPALHSGSLRMVEGAPEDCLVYVREHGGVRRLVALSFADEPRTLGMDAGDGGRVVLSTELDREGEAVAGVLGLRGHEGCVVALAGR
jgi:alpha-glucosidase